MEIISLDAMQFLLHIKVHHPQQQFCLCAGKHQIAYMILFQLASYRPHRTGQKLCQCQIELHAIALITVKTFFNPDNAYMEIFLIPDLLILYQGYAKAAGRNIHHQHTFPLAGNFRFFQSIPDSSKFSINFLRHINNVHYQSGLTVNLIQQENLVAGFTHGSCCLQLVFLYAIFFHQAFKTVEYFTNLIYHRKRNNIIFKGFLAQTDTPVTAFYNFISVDTAVFGNLHTDHFRTKMNGGKSSI